MTATPTYVAAVAAALTAAGVAVDIAELKKVAADYTRAEAKANQLRPRLYQLIWDYKVAHGERRGWQTQLVQITGLTRERIRQIITAEEKRRAAG